MPGLTGPPPVHTPEPAGPQELVSKKADAFDEGHRLYVYVQGRQFTLPPLVRCHTTCPRYMHPTQPFTPLPPPLPRALTVIDIHRCMSSSQSWTLHLEGM